MSNKKTINHGALFVGFEAFYGDDCYGENVPSRAIVRMDRATFERLNSYAADIKNGEISNITIPGDAANFRWLKSPQTDSEVIRVEGFFDAGVDVLLSNNEFNAMDLDPDSTGDGHILYRAHEMSNLGLDLLRQDGETMLGIRGICDGKHPFPAILHSWDVVARAARELYAAADSHSDSKELSPHVKVAVAAHNASGEPEIVVYNIECSEEQRESGEHYDLAKDRAEADGFQPEIAFDENDPAWSMLNLKTQNSTDVLVAVAGHNASGEPEIALYPIECSKEQYENGEHYELAKDMAESDGLDPSIAFAENDPAWSFMAVKTHKSTDVLMNQEGLQVIEQALLKASKKNPNDAPIQYVGESAMAFLEGLQSAYLHALEMMCISPPQAEKSKAAPQDRPRGG